MSDWIPEGAAPQMEELMEAAALPEGDRDEIRRFAEFLRRRKDKRDGKELPPAPEGMREWLTGSDKRE